AKKFDLKPDADIAVEIDPRLLTREWASAAAREGVTRASLGVQDFNPQVQAAIHRVQPFETVARARDALRDAGIASINLDLMYGLPRQTLGSLEATTAQAIELEPDRLSLFGYAHVPWMKPHQALIKETELPDARTRLLMQRQAAMDLEDAGFCRLGLDHFARREDALAEASAEHRMRRNFQGYTNDAADVVLGFGASAISRLPQGYAQNVADTRGWRERIEKGRLPVARGVVLDEEDRFRAALIERLMCDFFVDVAEVAEQHAWPLAEFEIDCKRLAEMEMDGLVYLSDGTVGVTEDGRDFVRSVAAVFDRYLERGTPARHAQGV
ncbi:MAG: radical SAM protein, partial [Methylovirgula sp.]